MTPTELLDWRARYWRAVSALARYPEAETRIGATPSDLVATLDATTLRRCRPSRAPRIGTPLLVVHGLIARAGLTDLDPERSLLSRLVAAGGDVWVIDWGDLGREARGLGFEDFVEDHLHDAVASIAAETGRPPALLGVCEGGLLSTCLAALEPEAISGLALAITPIDLHAEPLSPFAAWARSFDAATLEGLVDALGGLPGPTLAALFRAMEPARTLRAYGPDLLSLAENRAALGAFLRTERWLNDRPRHPVRAAKQLLVDLYLKNRLAVGTFALSGRPVRLDAIRSPVLCLYGRRDRIAPPDSARAVARLLAPQTSYEEVALDAGHVGVFLSRSAREETASALAGWLARLETRSITAPRRSAKARAPRSRSR